MNPAEKKALVDEIDRAYTEFGLTDSGAEISFRDAEKLPYLSAVIKESMRLHPSITYQLPRVVPDQGVQIRPYQIDKGFVCSIGPASMNRSKEIFGDDADEWKPERWLTSDEGDEKRIQSMSNNLTTVS